LGTHIIDAERDKVAATQLAVDGEINQGPVRGYGVPVATWLEWISHDPTAMVASGR